MRGIQNKYIGNSIICSDIWHKHHERYFEIVIRNFTSSQASEIWDNFEISRVVFVQNITCLYYYPQMVCNFHMQVFQIKLKYPCSKPIKLQKFLMQQYNEQKLLMESPSFLTLTECSSCKSFNHFLGRQSSGVLPVDSVRKTSMKCPRLFGSGTGCGILSVCGPTHLLLEHQGQRLEVSSLQACTTTEFH